MWSASCSSLVVRPLGTAFVKHVFVGSVGVELREGHAILAKDLTETLVVGVSKLAVFGHFSGFIKEFHDVNVLGRELSGVHMEFTKQTSRFPEGSDVSTADPWSAITRLFSSVNPSVLLRHGHYILNCHVLGSSEGSLFRDFEASSSKAFVNCLREKDVDGARNNLFQDWEKNRNHLVGYNWRPVVSGCVDPSEQEVVVSIRKSFSFVEEWLGGCLVEFGAHLIAQWHPGHMEVSIFCLLNPFSPLGLLETVGRPVPGILGLNDIKLTIETQSHDRVSGVRASSVHDNLVETV